MKGNKFLAAVLAASMAFSTVPVTALNVFASATVTSPDADVTGLPTNEQVENALADLATDKDSSGINAITTSNVDSALNTAISGDWASISGLTLSTGSSVSDSKATSDASGLAYRTFTFTLAAGDATQAYTVKLAADKMTDTEAASAAKTYITNYIATENTTPKTISKGSDLRNKVATAVQEFNKNNNTTVSASVSFDSQHSAYKVTCKSGEETSATEDTTISLKYTTDQVTVADKLNSTSSERKALQSAVVSNITTSNVKLTKKADGSYDTSTIASDIKAALPSTYSGVQNVSVIDDDHWSFEVYDGKATYSVTINTGADLDTDNAALKTALDNYFASNEVKTTKDKTLRNTDIAALVNADDSVKGVKNGFTIEGDGNALGSDGSGKLVIKNGTTTYTYNFTADVKVSDKSEAEANKEALATVNSNTYPEYAIDGTVKRAESTSVTHNEALLQNKLKSDLKDAGYNTTGLTFGRTANKTDADKTTNGGLRLYNGVN
jgi:hypothetical protein